MTKFRKSLTPFSCGRLACLLAGLCVQGFLSANVNVIFLRETTEVNTLLGPPAINSAGEVAFQATLQQSNFETEEGIYRSGAPEITSVAIEGSLYGTVGSYVLIGDDGGVSFAGELDDTGESGILTIPGSDFILQAPTPDFSAPIGVSSNGFYFMFGRQRGQPLLCGLNPFFEDRPDCVVLVDTFLRGELTLEIADMNSQGQVAFVYQAEAADPYTVKRTTVPRFEEGNQEMVLETVDLSQFTSILDVSIDESGTVWVHGKPPTGPEGIYNAVNGPPIPIVQIGQNGLTLIESLAVSPNGRFTFFGLANIGSKEIEGLFSGSDPIMDKIVAEGDEFSPSEGLAGRWRFERIHAGGLGPKSVNDSGAVAFVAEIEELTGDGKRKGIFTTTGVDSPDPDPDPEPVEGNHWNNPGGGTFGTATNWFDSDGNEQADDIPGSNDTAVFALPNTYTVTLSENRTVQEMIISGNGTDVTLDVNGHHFTPDKVSIAVRTGDDASLTLQGQETETTSVVLGESGDGRLILTGPTDFRTDALTVKSTGSSAHIIEAGLNDIALGFIQMEGGSVVIDGMPDDSLLPIGFSGLTMEQGRFDLKNGGSLGANGNPEIQLGTGGDSEAKLVARGVKDLGILIQSSGILMDGDLTVGVFGPGRLEVLDGASVNIANNVAGPASKGSLLIANGTAKGHVQVKGVNSVGSTRSNLKVKTLSMGGIAIGLEGQLEVIEGALLESESATIDGGGTAAGLEVFVGGAVDTLPAEWNAGALELHDGSIAIGTGGLLTGTLAQKSEPAELYVTDGGMVELNTDSAAPVDGIIQISGVSSNAIPAKLTFDDAFFGWEGPIQIVVENGGEFTIDGECQVGIFTAGNSIRISGVEASIHRSIMTIGEFTMGGILSTDSSGELRIEDGALFKTSNAQIEGSLTEEASYPSKVFVSGLSPDNAFIATWQNTQSLRVHSDASIILDQGLVSSRDLTVDFWGEVIGNGSLVVSNSIVNNGLTSPGLSPGTLKVEGSFVQGPSGTLQLEIMGPEPENQDLLEVTGDVDLGGTLQIIFSGHAPSQNDSFPLLEVNGNYSETDLEMQILGLQPGFEATCGMEGGKLILIAQSDGLLLTLEDSIQVMDISISRETGLRIPVFGIADVSYRFESSTDLETWELISEVTGENNLLEFRSLLPDGEDRRFYRVIQDPSS